MQRFEFWLSNFTEKMSQKPQQIKKKPCNRLGSSTVQEFELSMPNFKVFFEHRYRFDYARVKL